MELYKLTENCVYGALQAEMIRDIGSLYRNQRRSPVKKISACSELTLEKAKKIVRQQEAVQEQQQVLKDGKTSHWMKHRHAVKDT